MKKVLSAFLSLVMLFSITSGMTINAEAASVGTVSGLTVESKTTTTVKIKWKKVKKATGYQVYYSTSKNKNYKKAKSITKGKTVTAKITKLKSNKKYYFKVRAVKGKNKGKFSKVISVTTKKPEFVKPPCTNPSWDNIIIGEKVGKYYIWVEYNDEVEKYYLKTSVSKSTKDFKTIKTVSKNADNGFQVIYNDIISNGKVIYYVTGNSYSNCTIRSIKPNGKDDKKVVTLKSIRSIAGFYNGCIYYLRDIWGSDAPEPEDIYFCKYNLKTGKETVLYKNSWDIDFVLSSYGRYILFSEYHTGIDNHQITLYDAKTNKKTKIVKAMDAGLSGNTIYYSVYKYNDGVDYYYMYKCDFKGKKKKYVTLTYPPLFFGRNSAYFCMYWGGEDITNYYEYNYKTKKETKIL